jgi:hypothetical protein
MNEKGVRAKSAAHVTVPVAGCSGNGPYFFNRPFLLWIEQDGLSDVLFTAWLGYDSWLTFKTA